MTGHHRFSRHKENEDQMADNILVAKEAAVFRFGGELVRLRKDFTRVRVGHPLTVGREHLFKPLDVHYDYEDPNMDVEQATAAPGEARTTVRPEKADLVDRARALGHDVDGRTSVRRLEELVASGEADDDESDAEGDDND